MPRVTVAFTLAALLCATALYAQQAVPIAGEADYDKAARTILCDCGCHPQSVHDCACGRAAEMRNDLRALVAAGMTGDQIIAKYVAEHGEQIRIAPTGEGFNLVAWLGPLLGLGVASGVMLLLIRRWSSRREESEASEEPAPATTPATDDRYRQRLRDALENLE